MCGKGQQRQKGQKERIKLRERGVGRSQDEASEPCSDPNRESSDDELEPIGKDKDTDRDRERSTDKDESEHESEQEQESEQESVTRSSSRAEAAAAVMALTFGPVSGVGCGSGSHFASASATASASASGSAKWAGSFSGVRPGLPHGPVSGPAAKTSPDRKQRPASSAAVPGAVSASSASRVKSRFVGKRAGTWQVRQPARLLLAVCLHSFLPA